MDTELAAELMSSQLLEHNTANDDQPMGVIDQDSDSGTDVRSDEGAEEEGGEVDAFIGNVPVFIDENSVNRARVVEPEECEASSDEASSDEAEEDSGDEMDGAAPAVMPVQREALQVRAASLRRGQRIDGEGKRFRVDVLIGIQKKIIAKYHAMDVASVSGFKTFRLWVTTTFAANKVKVWRREQIEKWEKNIGKYEQGATVRDNKRCRLVMNPSAGPTTKLKALLLSYFQGVRSGDGYVSITSLLKRAQLLLTTDEDVKKDVKAWEDAHPLRHKVVLCSQWVKKFMDTHRLSLKKVKRRTLLTKDEVMVRAQKFHTHVHRCVRSGFVRFILQFDEMPGSLSGSMSGSLKIVTSKSDRDVRLNVSPEDFKRCCSLIPCVGVMFTVRPDGSTTASPFQLPTYILFKGAPVKAAILNEKFDGRTKRGWTPKAVMTGKFMTDTYVPFLVAAMQRLDMEGPKTGMLLLDSCRAHITAAVLQALHSHGIYPGVFPGGTTSWLQWVDTHLAALLRDLIFEQYLEARVHKRTASQKRALVHVLAANAMAAALMKLDVVENFTELGYIDPTVGRIRSIPEYSFVPPPVDTQAKDLARFEEKQRKALADGARAAAPAHTQGLEKWLVKRKPGEVDEAQGDEVVQVDDDAPVGGAPQVVTKPTLAGRQLGVVAGAARVGGAVKRPATTAAPNAKKVKKAQPPPKMPAVRPFNPPGPKKKPVVDVNADEDDIPSYVLQEQRASQAAFVLRRDKEIGEFVRVCTTMRMNITAVPADGHCLFHALVMAGHAGEDNYRGLRNNVATELLRDQALYRQYLGEVDMDRERTAFNMDLYCQEVRGEKYGGWTEVRALSNMLRVRIKVVQSTGFVESFDPQGVDPATTPLVWLSYHHHLFDAPHFQLMQ